MTRCALCGCLPRALQTLSWKAIKLQPKAASSRLRLVKNQKEAREKRPLASSRRRVPRLSTARRRNPNPRPPRALRKRKSRGTKTLNRSWRRAKRYPLLIGERSLQADHPPGLRFSLKKINLVLGEFGNHGGNYSSGSETASGEDRSRNDGVQERTR